MCDELFEQIHFSVVCKDYLAPIVKNLGDPLAEMLAAVGADTDELTRDAIRRQVDEYSIKYVVGFSPTLAQRRMITDAVTQAYAQAGGSDKDALALLQRTTAVLQRAETGGE